MTMPQEIRFEMPDGTVMRGVAHSGPQMEYATVEHVLPCGSVMRESVLRPVEAAPPAPEAPAPEPEHPAGGA